MWNLVYGVATILVALVAFRYRVKLRRVQRDNKLLQRANRELLLKNSHLLDDLDAAVEAIAIEGAKRRHPATRSQSWQLLHGGGSGVVEIKRVIDPDFRLINDGT